MKTKLGLLFVLAACGGSSTPPPSTAASAPSASAAATTTAAPASEPSATAAVSAPSGPQSLEKLKLTLPAQWPREYSADSKCVSVTGARSASAPPAMVNICRIDQVPGSSAKDFQAFERKKEGWDKGTTAELVKKEDWPGGFAATYKVRPEIDPKHPHQQFMAVWKVGDDLLWCDGRQVPAGQGDQVKSVCQSASW